MCSVLWTGVVGMCQKNQNEEEGLATAAAVTQAARDRKAGCLPLIGQSGAPAASPTPQGVVGDRHGMRYQGDVTPSPLKQRPNICGICCVQALYQSLMFLISTPQLLGT